jgi:hypothetical protein
MVLPELLPVTYAKIRAELERELAAHPVAVTPSPSDPFADPSDWEEARDNIDAADERVSDPRPDPVRAVVLTADLARLLVVAANGRVRLPSAVAGPNEAAWRAALRSAGELSGGVDLGGWAGQTHAEIGGPGALTFLAREADPLLSGADGRRWIATSRIDEELPSPFDRAAVRQALANLAPGVAAP